VTSDETDIPDRSRLLDTHHPPFTIHHTKRLIIPWHKSKRITLDSDQLPHLRDLLPIPTGYSGGMEGNRSDPQTWPIDN
jgi:hypothetical protein